MNEMKAFLDCEKKRNGEWRIAHRLIFYDWCQGWGQSIDWPQSVMSPPFSAEHSSGRSVGACSEGVFGKFKDRFGDRYRSRKR